MSRVQLATFPCECGSTAIVSPIAGSPREFDATCPACGRLYKLSWHHDEPPPFFEDVDTPTPRLPLRSDEPCP